MWWFAIFWCFTIMWSCWHILQLGSNRWGAEVSVHKTRFGRDPFVWIVEDELLEELSCIIWSFWYQIFQMHWLCLWECYLWVVRQILETKYNVWLYSMVDTWLTKALEHALCPAAVSVLQVLHNVQLQVHVHQVPHLEIQSINHKGQLVSSFLTSYSPGSGYALNFPPPGSRSAFTMQKMRTRIQEETI